MANGTRPPVSPLNDSHLQGIKDNIKKLDEAQAQIDLAKRAGFDVGDQEKTVREQRAQLQRIRTVYFPNE